MPHFSTKEEKVQYVFARIAKRYDLMNSVLSLWQHKLWRQRTMKMMNVRPGSQSIDVCTGTADWAISLAKAAGPTGHVVGLDFSKEMLAQAPKKLKEEQIEDRVELVHGDAMDLPYSPDTFDYATIGFALRNVPDIDQVLQEMTRVVKPGGMVVSLELSKPTWPIFKQLYYLYFQRILPAVGSWVSKDSVSYHWLPESLKSFPDMEQLAQKMRDIGLENVQYRPLMGGIAAIHIGYKPTT